MRHVSILAALSILLTAAPALAQSPAEALAMPYDEAPSVRPPAAPAASSVPRPAGPSGEAAALGAPVAPAPFRLDPEIAAMRSDDPHYDHDYTPARSERRDDDGGPDFGVSFGHSWAGFGIGLATGALAGGIVGGAACGNGSMCWLMAMVGSGMGGVTMAPLGAALGTWGFGEISGGTGNFFAALGGAYAGAGLGAGITALLSFADGGVAGTIGTVASLALVNLGAALGYQLSSHGSRDARPAPSGTTIVPLAGPTDDGHGLTAGAAGTF
ncbi:MAG TPA: hypothetical protein RMH99_28865 [Sandaracinaceae bacterium LLY-WYZ-13_1]|nr:hypothetical protein [Sandaracinaceae bacterium LLY-WYZ-13_1]